MNIQCAKMMFTLKHPGSWGHFPCCADPKLLDEYQEGKDKKWQAKQKTPGNIVKRGGQGIVRNYWVWLLALYLKIVQVLPGKVLDQLVPVGHYSCLSYTYLTLLCVNLQYKNHSVNDEEGSSRNKNLLIQPCPWRWTRPGHPSGPYPGVERAMHYINVAPKLILINILPLAQVPWHSIHLLHWLARWTNHMLALYVVLV